ncbi:MAG: hypothetical protein J2P19_28485 [Pseudonocardia sp.]|nr:hypothetical protein [Pseudonocardia sp.]
MDDRRVTRAVRRSWPQRPWADSGVFADGYGVVGAVREVIPVDVEIAGYS